MNLVNGLDQFARLRVIHYVSHGTRFDGWNNFFIPNKTGHRHYPRMRLPGSDLAGGLNSIHDGQKQIHQDYIRFELFGKADGLQPVFCFTDNLDVVQFCQEGFDASTDNGVVVYD